MTIRRKAQAKRRQKYRAAVISRVERRFAGMQAVLALLEPAGVKRDARGLWACQQHTGL